MKARHPESQERFLGPALKGDRRWRDSDAPGIPFVPRPFAGWETEVLKGLGLAFRREDLGGKNQPAPFLDSGVVSTDRCMVILICDVKGSTPMLRALRPDEFRRHVQQPFFSECIAVLRGVNPKPDPARDGFLPYPRAVRDKFMGDGVMIYVDCGNHGTTDAPLDKAAPMVMRIIDGIIRALDGLPEKPEVRLRGGRLGARFGVACGDGITLGVLGPGGAEPAIRDPGDFSVTGEAVNMAARLEHATPADFLACMEESRARLERYARLVPDRAQLHGTVLGAALAASGRQAAELHEVCEKRFEIRADGRFRALLDERPGADRLAWRQVPFSARGFGGEAGSAHLLGGDSAAELFRDA
jgi:class 3 adenylate cyclase